MSVDCSLCSHGLGITVIALFALNHLPIYRNLRRFELLLVIAFLLYRLQKGGNTLESMNTLLDDVYITLKLIARYVAVKLVGVLGDIVVILAIWKGISVAKALTKTNLRGMKKDVFDWGFLLVKDFSVCQGNLGKGTKQTRTILRGVEVENSCSRNTKHHSS